MDTTQVVTKLDVAKIRADFPILNQTLEEGVTLAYLDNAASTQRPRQVIDAISGVYETSYANVHRGAHRLSSLSTDMYEASRHAVSDFIGAKSTQEIVFTYGTTFGINLVARAYGDAFLLAGDEILITEMEHHSNLVPWQQLAERTGAVLKVLPITPDGLLEVERLGEFLSERTKIVAFSAVSNVLGTVNPVSEIVRQAHEVGAVVLVDAAQAIPHQVVNVGAWDADFVAFSAHKMLGPSGLGILYGKEDLLDQMPPFLGGGSMISSVTLKGFTPAMLPAKFEAGTPPISGAIALKSAIEYLQKIGLDNILQHERILAEHAHHRLAEVPGLRILGPEVSQKAGTVSFVIDGLSPYDIATLLDSRGVAIREGHHCAIPLHQKLGVTSSARASFYLYNTLEEVDRLADGVLQAQRILA